MNQPQRMSSGTDGSWAPLLEQAGVQESGCSSSLCSHATGGKKHMDLFKITPQGQKWPHVHLSAGGQTRLHGLVSTQQQDLTFLICLHICKGSVQALTHHCHWITCTYSKMMYYIQDLGPEDSTYILYLIGLSVRAVTPRVWSIFIYMHEVRPTSVPQTQV